MKKKSMILCFLTLIQLSVFCQADFPKLIELEGKKVVVLDSVNVSKINLTFIELDECGELKLLLEEEVQLLHQSDKVQKERINNLEEQKKTMMLVDQEQQLQIEILEGESKKKDRKIKLLKATRTLFTAVGVVGGAYLGYIGSKFLPVI